MHPHLSIDGKIFVGLPLIFHHRPHPLPSHRPRVVYQWGPGSRCYDSSPRAQNGRPSRGEGRRAAPNRTRGLRPTFCSRLPRVGERQIVSAPFGAPLCGSGTVTARARQARDRTRRFAAHAHFPVRSGNGHEVGSDASHRGLRRGARLLRAFTARSGTARQRAAPGLFNPEPRLLSLSPTIVFFSSVFVFLASFHALPRFRSHPMAPKRSGGGSSSREPSRRRRTGPGGSPSWRSTLRA